MDVVNKGGASHRMRTLVVRNRVPCLFVDGLRERRSTAFGWPCTALDGVPGTPIAVYVEHGQGK